jgi:hypothetical protein
MILYAKNRPTEKLESSTRSELTSQMVEETTTELKSSTTTSTTTATTTTPPVIKSLHSAKYIFISLDLTAL